MRATDFEFRYRWWLFGGIFCTGVLTLAFDQNLLGARLAPFVQTHLHVGEPTAYRLIFGLASTVMVVAALLRTWASSYLGREVVHDGEMHSDVLRADGPYRYVRNPLYFGNLLMAVAFALVTPPAGSVWIILCITLYCYRLIGREEAGLEAAQGERYREYRHAVPRMFPSLWPRIARGAARPDWANGLASEAFFWSFAMGLMMFTATLQFYWLSIGFMASPLLSWLAGLALRGRKAKTQRVEAP